MFIVLGYKIISLVIIVLALSRTVILRDLWNLPYQVIRESRNFFLFKSMIINWRSFLQFNNYWAYRFKGSYCLLQGGTHVMFTRNYSYNKQNWNFRQNLYKCCTRSMQIGLILCCYSTIPYNWQTIYYNGLWSIKATTCFIFNMILFINNKFKGSPFFEAIQRDFSFQCMSKYSKYCLLYSCSLYFVRVNLFSYFIFLFKPWPHG